MKLRTFAILIFLFAMAEGCRKEHHFMNDGVIVGWNNGYCATCGGFYLNLSNDTTKNANTYYVLNYSASITDLINQLSMQYNKDLKPIYVSVDWQPLQVPEPPANWIHVTNIKTR